ncbi:MAG: acetylglutamate kinase [Acidobacteria bacterium]|nr:acetylglutamate kinase [Acidobacteriota bacterium]
MKQRSHSRRADSARGRRPGALPCTVLKLGGELLESRDDIQALVAASASLRKDGALVIVHGGGREIDSAAARVGLTKQSIDGLRITDAATLEIVMAVVGGVINSRLVAALVEQNVRAVGLTGADAGIARMARAPAYRARDGRLVDLGLVGEPDDDSTPELLVDLCTAGYVPVIACLGLGPDAQVLNVNADTLAADFAVRLGAERLVIAGGTNGVLDEAGRTIGSLDAAAIERLIAGGGAQAGMVAKLIACRKAMQAGVSEVAIVDGHEARNILDLRGTRLRGGGRSSFTGPRPDTLEAPF